MVQKLDSEEFEIGADGAEEEDKDPESIESILAQALKDAKGADDGADADTGSIFSEPMKEPEVDTAVSMEDGQKLLEEAEARKRNPKGQFTKAAEEAPAAAPEAEAEAKAELEKPAEPETPPTYDTVLQGLTEPQRAAISARVGIADEVGSIYTANEGLKIYGENPQAAFKRLAEINAYAMSNPGEYLAWAAGTVSPDKPEDVLGKAAAVLGFKIVPADAPAQGEDDPFEDPAVKELKAENARLRAAQQPAPVLGPDNPAQRAQQDLIAFQSETAKDGTPLRPLFDQLSPQIAAAAQALVAKTGKPITVADLGQIYEDTVAGIRGKLGIVTPEPTIAAQPAPPVATVDPKKAAAIAKAQAASKSLDGAGHGAGRPPAPPEGASIADTMKFIMAQSGG